MVFHNTPRAGVTHTHEPPKTSHPPRPTRPPTVFNGHLGGCSLTRRRDATRVIHDILLLGKNGASKTQIVSKANLNFPLAERYLSFLLMKEHLQQGIDLDGVRKYSLTERGGRLLLFVSEVEKELEGFFPTGKASNIRGIPHQTLLRTD